MAAAPSKRRWRNLLMNFRHRLGRLCSTGCGLLVILLSLAFVPTAQAIPLTRKVAPDADKDRPQIATEIKTQVDKITSGDPADRSKAREALIAEVNAPGNQPFSSAFLDAYAQEIN